MLRYDWKKTVSVDEILDSARNFYCGQTVPENLNNETNISEFFGDSGEDVPGMSLIAIILDIEETRGIRVSNEILEEVETFEELRQAINGIINRTNEQLLRVTPRLIAGYFAEIHGGNVDMIENAINGTVKEFLCNYYGDDIFTNPEPPVLWDLMEPFARALCLEIDDDEQNELNTLCMMKDAVTFLDNKAAARRQNDCLVRYGNNWSCCLRNTTRIMLSKGGTYPMPYIMKHIMGRGGQILPRPEGFNGFCVIGLKDERGTLLCQEFKSIDDVIDSGWAVD